MSNIATMLCFLAVIFGLPWALDHGGSFREVDEAE